jgi:hypothetical protein
MRKYWRGKMHTEKIFPFFHFFVQSIEKFDNFQAGGDVRWTLFAAPTPSDHTSTDLERWGRHANHWLFLLIQKGEAIPICLERRE